jgi:hypothetical protein
MNATLPDRDERTVMVENAGYRMSYLGLPCGLLLAGVYRSFLLHQTPRDLLALVVGSGFVSAAYQGLHRVFGSRWVRVSGVAFALALVVAAGLALLRR